MLESRVCSIRIARPSFIHALGRTGARAPLDPCRARLSVSPRRGDRAQLVTETGRGSILAVLAEPVQALGIYHNGRAVPAAFCLPYTHFSSRDSWPAL